MGHLGSRVTALLDGRLPAAEEERAWEHVHACHPCRDAVEHEGWVKTRLAQLGCSSATSSPSSLRQSLLDGSFVAGRVACEPPASVPASTAPPVRARHFAALGGSALGVAVVGVMALGAPANAPQLDRRGPTTSVVPTVSTTDTRLALTRPSVAATVRRGAVEETMAP